ncbi:YeeE/YedE family protein [Alkalicoccus urumqiensis]|uniref:Uncharacterized protein n=1 Tax=Alkalicoccus urumqiensis TaxID=1548213 RepID=A0A2P6MLD5_ALKUR|nr:YeeE/YedE family protein [Alkalicoccus urumqiensis]PRO67097.1 hypothetical protein C6I21_00580 [Alkalicoccus urumqiensis]
MTEDQTKYEDPQYGWLLAFAAASVFVLWMSYTTSGWQFVVLFVLGFLIGFTLFHTRYGFSSVYTQILEDGNTQMLRGHMQKLIIAVTLFALILSTQTGLFGVRPEGAVSPVSFGVVIGAFLFGFGMNIGSNMGPAAMKTKEGGRTALLFTVTGFLTGATIGGAHYALWNVSLPHMSPISLAEDTPLGYIGAWLLQTGIFAAVILGSYLYKKKRRPPALPPMPRGTGFREVLFHWWPIWVGATVFAVLNAAVLLVQGSPWKLTAAFTLWGSKISDAVGFDPASWRYWGDQAAVTDLTNSIFTSSLSVLNFGVVAGTLVTMALAGLMRFSGITLLNAVMTLAGGLLMGYGAAISFGANVGAYFSGLASMSLHAWVWTLFAVLGVYTAYYAGNKLPYLRQ